MSTQKKYFLNCHKTRQAIIKYIGDKMNSIELLNTKLTELQEVILCELEKTNNAQLICKKLNIKPITLSKTISPQLSNK